MSESKVPKSPKNRAILSPIPIDEFMKLQKQKSQEEKPKITTKKKKNPNKKKDNTNKPEKENLKIESIPHEGKTAEELEYEIKKNIIKIAGTTKQKKSGKPGQKTKKKLVSETTTVLKPNPNNKILPVVQSADPKLSRHITKSSSAPLPARKPLHPSTKQQTLQKPTKKKEKNFPNFFPPEYFGMKNVKMPFLIRSSDKINQRKVKVTGKTTLNNMFKPVRSAPSPHPRLFKPLQRNNQLSLVYSRDKEKKNEQLRNDRQKKISVRTKNDNKKKAPKKQNKGQRNQIIEIMNQIKKLKNKVNNMNKSVHSDKILPPSSPKLIKIK